MPEILKQLSADLSGVLSVARRSLVTINGRRHSQGAGVIWSDNGLIVTNAHVVRRHRQFDVKLPDGRTVPGTVIGRMDEYDLAALKINAADLTPIVRGDSQKLKAGEWVTALGHPWGIRGASTAGVVIGVGADLPENPMPGREWVAVSLHYRPGHSGGPLVDTYGRLLGFNTVMAGPDVGLAVPVHIANQFMESLDQVAIS